MRDIFLKSLKKTLYEKDPKYADIFSGHETVYSPTYLDSLIIPLIKEKSYITSEWYLLYRIFQLNKPSVLKNVGHDIDSLMIAYLSAMTDEVLNKYPFAINDKEKIIECMKSTQVSPSG